MQEQDLKPGTFYARPGRPDDKASLARLDYAFSITAEAVGPFHGPCVTHQTVPVARRVKAYAFDEEALAGCLDRDDRRLFVAVDADDIPHGYAAASVAWNGFVSVDDLAVDAAHRGGGGGRTLMDAVVAWARQRQAAGIRLETQTNNIPACRFYERYGFLLGGFDRYLYASDAEHRTEVALYWYLIFDRR